MGVFNCPGSPDREDYDSEQAYSGARNQFWIDTLGYEYVRMSRHEKRKAKMEYVLSTSTSLNFAAPVPYNFRDPFPVSECDCDDCTYDLDCLLNKEESNMYSE